MSLPFLLWSAFDLYPIFVDNDIIIFKSGYDTGECDFLSTPPAMCVSFIAGVIDAEIHITSFAMVLNLNCVHTSGSFFSVISGH